LAAVGADQLYRLMIVMMFMMAAIAGHQAHGDQQTAQENLRWGKYQCDNVRKQTGHAAI
jgi:hypothetical protein